MTKTSLTLILLCTAGTARANTGNSYAPIVGYDDKDGALYGAAAFHFDDGSSDQNLGAYGVTNGKDVDCLTLEDSQREGGWNLSAVTHLNRTFDNYYGEGDATSPSEPLRINENEADLDSAALQFGETF